MTQIPMMMHLMVRCWNLSILGPMMMHLREGENFTQEHIEDEIHKIEEAHAKSIRKLEY